MPDNLRFGGGVSSSIINPFVALVVLVAGILICVWPRNKAVLPFIFASILVPTDQVLLIGGLHFPMMRVLILFGLFRIFRTKATSRSQIISGGMNKIDIAVVLLAVSSAVAGVILWQQSAVVTYQLGELFSTFGTYFILRFFIRDREDVLRVIRSFAYITLFVAAVMLIEQWRGWNPYALLGGARAEFFASSMQRDDRFRATGCFAHPILAGTFGAIMVPLFIGMWFVDRKQRRLAVVGCFASMLMILASNSSTPITGLAAGLLALSLWPFRDYMTFFRRGIVITLVMLHMVMKAPVWHLISRIDLSGGSSSYHRYALINETIIHFWEWWLVGTKSNADWGWDMWDTANQYVSTAVTSGLLPLLIFVAVLVYCFKYLGKARRRASSRKDRLFFWALGACVFANLVSFVGISYFDQTIVAWYSILAMISAVAVGYRRETVSQQSDQVEEPQVLRPALAPSSAGAAVDTNFVRPGIGQSLGEGLLK